MVQDAREHESDDRKRRELIEARNNADNLAYQTEKTLNDLGEKIPVEERQNIETKISELRETIKSDDIDSIRNQTEQSPECFPCHKPANVCSTAAGRNWQQRT